jgi:nicotinamidase-related amidase
MMNCTIIEEWDTISTPSPPELQKISVNPQDTGLLICDIQNQNCNEKRRPRCVERLTVLKTLLFAARTHGLPVFYTLTSSAGTQDIRKEVQPQQGEPIVKSGVDKFYNTDLEHIVREKGVKTVIITGTSAHGAVLHTATGACLRGFRVIVPVDGLSAGDPYAEQYTLWHMGNAPGTRGNTLLTRIDWISIE